MYSDAEFDAGGNTFLQKYCIFFQQTMQEEAMAKT
jgi:hypothetical protein